MNLHLNYKQIILWLVPVFMCFGFEFFFTEFRGYNIRNGVENFLFAISFMLLIHVLGNVNSKAKWAKLFYVLFVVSLCLESIFYYLFSSYFTESSIFILLETNPSETSEFISMYLDINVLVFLISMLTLVIVYFKSTRKDIFIFTTRFHRIYLLPPFLIIVLGLFFSVLHITHLPYQVVKGVLSYSQEINKYNDLNIHHSLGNFQEVAFEGVEKPHTFVVIIGESTTRNQLGIYDFYRETTPRLSQQKNDLLIYQDVISSQSHTIESLQAALSLNNFQDKTESTLVQLMNQAEFKTFWLSNQNPIGMYATLLTKMAKAADEYTFTNLGRWNSFTPFDEALFPHLDEALADEAQNKFIIINLLATHGQYKMRYPKAFSTFSDTPKTDFPSEKNHQIINEYHNAILYVDFIVSEIIHKVEAQEGIGYVLYFSDHGEEVFQTKEFFGHSDTDLPTQSMFEIPFFVWLSPAYKSTYNLIYQPNRPYVLDDLLHSVSDLSKVKFREYQAEKSIFSKEFQPIKRTISDGLDFDTYFTE